MTAAGLIALVAAALAAGWLARFGRRARAASQWIDYDAQLLGDTTGIDR